MTAAETRTAPDYQFVDEAGRQIRLSELWSSAEKGIVLVFLRHFGCMFCRDLARQLREHYDEFQRRGYEIVAIGQGTPQRSVQFRSDNRLPYPVLGDRELTSYRRYGLTSGSLGGFLQPKAYKAAVRAVLHGNLPGKPEGDVNQNPGVFLIDRTGRILRAHIGRHAADYPAAAELLEWIDAEIASAIG